MRSLYIKIFLWFWLAMVLVGAAVAFSIVATQTEFTRANEEANDVTLTPPFAERWAAVFEKQGTSGLDEYVKHVRGVGGNAYFFSEDGTEQLGQSPPNDASAAFQSARGTDQTQIAWGATHKYIAQRAEGPSGKHYVLLLDIRSRLAKVFLAKPGAQALRLLVAILVGGLVCLWLARYITAPVKKLRVAARQLANGHLSSRVGSAGVHRKDELADLGRDFDRMAERIESLMSSQQRLIYSVSHELRSPLARLNVALGLARKNAGPEIRVPLDRIEREAARLNDLIGNLLTIARWENGAEPGNQVYVDLDELVHEVAADADFEARSRERSVRVLAVEPCGITGVRELLHTAIENVVRNAVNYTNPGSEVEISLERVQDDGVIRVRDHGEGVPEEALERIFRPFYRVADARERSSGGTGLGLSITEKAVRLHGGQVKARNCVAGGLLVELQFPLHADTAEVKSGFLQASLTNADI